MGREDFEKGYKKAMQYYPRDFGHWKQCSNGGFVCSSCGTPIANVKRIPDYLFCPHCGANMYTRKDNG